MPNITDYIKRPGVFCPEEISSMSDAYDFSLRSFSTPPSTSVRETLAANIIAIAGSGERDPQRLCERALSAFGMAVQPQEIQIYDAFALPVCLTCKTAMRLFGIETDAIGRELRSFVCSQCEHIKTTSDRYQ
jgi:hypothetical protein